MVVTQLLDLLQCLRPLENGPYFRRLCLSHINHSYFKIKCALRYISDDEPRNVLSTVFFSPISQFLAVLTRVSRLACGLDSCYLEVRGGGWQRCLCRSQCCSQCTATLCPSQSTSREFRSYFCDVKMTVTPNICLCRSAEFKIAFILLP